MPLSKVSKVLKTDAEVETEQQSKVETENQITDSAAETEEQ